MSNNNMHDDNLSIQQVYEVPNPNPGYGDDQIWDTDENNSPIYVGDVDFDENDNPIHYIGCLPPSLEADVSVDMYINNQNVSLPFAINRESPAILFHDESVNTLLGDGLHHFSAFGRPVAWSIGNLASESALDEAQHAIYQFRTSTNVITGDTKFILTFTADSGGGGEMELDTIEDFKTALMLLAASYQNIMSLVPREEEK